MALFDLSENALVDERKAYAKTVKAEREEVRLSGRYQCLKSTIGEIEHGKTVHFVTSGAWSMHDLAKYVISQIGACEMDAFTFAWGPNATRELGQLVEDGTIRRIRIAINSVMKRWCTPALVKMKDYGQVIMLPIHAKGFTLGNDEWKVSCLGSANFSNYQTIEGGTICTLPEIYDFHKTWLDHMFQTGDEFLVDKVLDTFTEPKTAQTHEKILFLIRGLPGSGKSTLAHEIADEVFENDDYFSFGGEYKFSQEKLSHAKAECHKNCRDAMERKVAKVAVANTFIDEAGLEPYYKLAEIFGYTVFCFVCENRTGNRNIHGVPEQTLKNMRKNIRVRL